MPPRSSTMFLAEIVTAGAISAYFFRHITSAYSLNVSDPIKGQPVQLSDYLFVFGCGLVFWLLVMLRAKLHDSGDRQADIRKVANLAKLITLITTLNLCGGLLAPFMKLPLLVRFLVLFQVSSNLALLLIWTFLSLKECMIVPDARTQQQQKSPPDPQAEYKNFFRQPLHRSAEICKNYQVEEIKAKSAKNCKIFQKPLVPQVESEKLSHHRVSSISLANKMRKTKKLSPEKPPEGIGESHATLQSSRSEEGSVARNKATRVAVHNVDGVGGKVDEAGGSGSGHDSGASGREENSGRCGGNDGGGGAGGGGDRGESGSGDGSGASGSGENSGGYGGHGRDEGGTGSGHGGGSGGNRGGSEGGDRGRDGGGGDLESGGRETNTEQAFKSSKITEMSLMLTGQTTAALIGFHLTTPSSSSKALLVVVLIDQLVAYLCCLTSMLLSSNKPEDSKAAKIFADIGLVCTALGFILMVAMFVPWYLVLIAVLLFGVVWLIFFRNGLKTGATEVWNYLKNARNL